MIAALVLVALVAVSQAQVLLQLDPPEAVPHFPSALTSGNVEPNPMEVLHCFVNHLDKIYDMLVLLSDHEKEVISATIDLGALLAPCQHSEDKKACADQAWDAFIASDLDPSVRAIHNRGVAFVYSFGKCIGI